jgi:hypothetical protein
VALDVTATALDPMRGSTAVTAVNTEDLQACMYLHTLFVLLVVLHTLLVLLEVPAYPV